MLSMLTMLFEDKPGTSVGTIVLIAVLLVAFVGLIWFSSYSQKKKQKQAVEMNSALKIGDRVKTIGGIVGTIVGIDGDNGNFEIESGTTTMVLDRNAVYPLNYFDAQNAKGGHKAAEATPANADADDAEDVIADDEVEAGDEIAPEGETEKTSDDSDKE